MSDLRCALCAAYDKGLRAWTYTQDTDIKVCQGHWNNILTEAQDGPYMNLPPGKVQLLDDGAVS
jgi:hypothetical protein